MSNDLQSIAIDQLSAVCGGEAATPPTPPPQPPPPQQPQQPKPQGPNTDWIRNTISCARIGGPVLGALCGIFTPTPAY